ncbi:hypothetical protein [Caulobacter segnis]
MALPRISTDVLAAATTILVITVLFGQIFRPPRAGGAPLTIGRLRCSEPK